MLDLKNNLTSLGIINSNGCKYNIKDRILEIINRVLVIMKGQKCEKLYYLEENIIINRLIIISTKEKRAILFIYGIFTWVIWMNKISQSSTSNSFLMESIHIS